MADDLRPRRLRADNFTPPSRTPWGGQRILGRYKLDLGLNTGDSVVGESWEVSVEPSFPSRVADGGGTLAALLATAPALWLGSEGAARFDGQTPLLVKLLDAADNLSVQVHPADGDVALAADESGKPEAWVVLDAVAGAGLYLGFRDGVARGDVQECISTSGALDQLMTFVPVSPGDAFVIAAGTPHAIGAGLTLLEPQFVAPGRRGVTYRFWDWNRRYDAHGRRDDTGQPRQLHLERSLAVTRWEGLRGEAFVDSCRASATMLVEGALRHERVVDWPWFVVERWQGTGEGSQPACGKLLAVTCVAGQVAIEGATGSLALRCGQSGVVPAAAGALRISAREALAFTTRA